MCYARVQEKVKRWHFLIARVEEAVLMFDQPGRPTRHSFIASRKLGGFGKS